jgi:hypothetical protein
VEANDPFVFLDVYFVLRDQARFGRFSAVVTDKLYLGDAVVTLDNPEGQNYFPPLALRSFAIRYSMYSFMVQFLACAILRIS